MQEGPIQFKRNGVWDLVPRLVDKTFIGIRWVFRNKMNENDIITKNKEILVAVGYNKAEGIDYKETYVPVARTCSLDFKLYQMDIKYNFLNSHINKELYILQPPGFEDHDNPS